MRMMREAALITLTNVAGLLLWCMWGQPSAWIVWALLAVAALCVVALLAGEDRVRQGTMGRR